MSCLNRDVCKLGFPNEQIVQRYGGATQLFLDLPSPWLVVPSAAKIINPERIGRICCFSPCIEQVQRTCEALKKEGFTEIKMFEVLTRDHQISTEVIPDLPLLFDADALKVDKIDKRKRGHGSGAKITGGTLMTSCGDTMRGHTSYLTFAILLPKI